MLEEIMAYFKLATKNNYLMIIVPFVFVALLFIGCRFKKIREWNDNYLSLKQINYIRGFCVLGILLHHVSQVTAAEWIEYKYIIHGLDLFVDIGYLFVGLFLFVSGYGLYVSYKNKENYFKHYFIRRLLPVVLAFITTEAVYLLYKGIPSTYTWYVYAILLCYLLFYIGFRFIKNEHISLLIVLIGIAAYCSFCWNFEYGGWWYNTVGLFCIGLVFAKYEKYIVNVMKKGYLPLIIITFALMLVCRYYGKFYEASVYGIFDKEIIDLYNLYIILFRFAAATLFTLLVLFVSLKVEFRNPILLFYNSISLEFYLIQGLFVNMFGPYYMDPSIKSLYYIKNVPLLLLVCFVASTISGLLLHYFDKAIVKLVNKIAVKNN